MYTYRLPKKQVLTQLCYEVVQHIHCPVQGLIYHRITVCILETCLREIMQPEMPKGSLDAVQQRCIAILVLK